jgi:methylglutaconyl-CoA hydratase
MTLAPDPVLLDVSAEGAAYVRINRPDKRNAFDEFVIAGLADTFETLKNQERVRVVFLRGSGDHFSAGADVDWMSRQGARTREDNEADALAMAHMFKALHDMPQFTVALVEGAALGGGLGLIAACDWAVAARNSRFALSEVKLGLTPATISPYVIEAIGVRAARGLFASAHPFGSAEALRMGLVQEVVDDAVGLDAAAERLANLVFDNAPGAVAEAKELVRAVSDSATRPRLPGAPAHLVDEHLMKETARRIAARRASPEGKEGLAAFLEKRKPSWSQN